MRAEELSATPLQLRMDHFAKVIGIAVGVAALVAFGSGVALGESVQDMFLVAVALAVSAVPEGLPVAVTITLAVGCDAWPAATRRDRHGHGGQGHRRGNARSEAESVLRRNPFSNRFLFLATTAALSIHVAALYLPPTQYLLRVEPIDLGAWLRIVVIATSILFAMDAHKWFRRQRG